MTKNITNIDKSGEIVLYQPNDAISLEVKLDTRLDTVWLTKKQMAQLFNRDRSVISRHIASTFEQGEVDKSMGCAFFAQTTKHGAIDGKTQTDNIEYYNLDVIISVGYRVHSRQGVLFRRWATKVLREYLLQGYSVNHQLIALQERTDERFSNMQKQLDNQQEKVDFLVNMHQQPAEELFATGCMWDAYSFIANLIRTAKISVVLVDNYCNDKTLTLLDERKDGVNATVHTTYNKAFEEALNAHNSQRPQIDFIQLPHKIHDRFLIVDSDVYLLGNSLKDMGHTLSAAIKTGFTPNDVLEKLV